MTKVSFELNVILNVKPSVIYEAWLDSSIHSKMTGGKAECSKNVGGSFSAWDGYIEGMNIALEPYKEIIQSWRTSEFEESDEDSILNIQFEEIENGTKLTLIHSSIPDGQTQYEQGWQEHYFTPMRKYFENL